MRLSRLANPDPFAELSPEGREAMRRFAESLNYWMGFSRSISLKDLRKIWGESPELKAWLTRHVNRPATLYFGGRVDHAEDLPKVGSTFRRKGTVSHWSKERDTSEWFAGFGGLANQEGGYLLMAKPPVGSIIVDVDAFSTLAGRHRESFKSMMTKKGIDEMFSGEQYEGEVITTAINATVLEVVEKGGKPGWRNS